MNKLSGKAGISQIVFFLLLILCLFPFITAPIALAIGIIYAFALGNPFPKQTSKYTAMLLKTCVVGLGFGIQVNQALEAGSKGVLFTIVTIAGTLVLGYFIGKWARIDKKISYLISCGTAICGGSAIAAVAPVVKADQHQISVSLGTVFILNAVALFVFPVIGNYFNMSQAQFGLWAAIAIHDTSSVVGAASKYGAEALQIATTVKLARALWIIPLVFFSAFIFKNKESKINIPYFIFLFFAAMLLNSFIPAIGPVTAVFSDIAKRGIVVVLFLIGSALSKEALKSVGVKPFVQGIVLWIVIAAVSLFSIMKAV
ncbi:putative sulfate exporter family transporter [soil metagenome]